MGACRGEGLRGQRAPGLRRDLGARGSWRGRDPFAGSPPLEGEEPGLLAGLVLSGVNVADDERGAREDGVLTATEMAAIDLVVLSARRALRVPELRRHPSVGRGPAEPSTWFSRGRRTVRDRVALEGRRRGDAATHEGVVRGAVGRGTWRRGHAATSSPQAAARHARPVLLGRVHALGRVEMSSDRWTTESWSFGQSELDRFATAGRRAPRSYSSSRAERPARGQTTEP